MNKYINLILFSICLTYHIPPDTPDNALRLFSSYNCSPYTDNCLLMLNSKNGDVFIADKLSEMELDMFDLKFSWFKVFSFDGIAIDLSEYNTPEFKEKIESGIIKFPNNYEIDKYDFSFNNGNGYLLETDTGVLYKSSDSKWKKIVSNSKDIDKREIGSYRISVLDNQIYLLQGRELFELNDSLWVYVGDFISD